MYEVFCHFFWSNLANCLVYEEEWHYWNYSALTRELERSSDRLVDFLICWCSFSALSNMGKSQKRARKGKLPNEPVRKLVPVEWHSKCFPSSGKTCFYFFWRIFSHPIRWIILTSSGRKLPFSSRDKFPFSSGFVISHFAVSCGFV